MKYIKKYETLYDEDPIEVGEYVKCTENSIEKETLKNFLKNNVGRIVMYDIELGKYPYKITFDDIPINILSEFFAYSDYLKCYTRSFERAEILVHSKNKEDIVHLMSANKYNL